MKNPTNRPAIHIVDWIVTATSPSEYAIDPQATKVPTEKKLINKERPLIHHGTAPPAEKNDFMFLPLLAKDIPVMNTTTEKRTMVEVSKNPIL